MNPLHVRGTASFKIGILLIPIVFALVIAIVTAPSASAFHATTIGGTLTSSQNPSTYGQAVTFTFTETPTTAGVKGDGIASIGFYDGSNLMGSGPCVFVIVHVCTFTTSSLSIGVHSIHAVSASGPSLSQTVNGPADVPEASTLLLFTGGIGGMATWLRLKWSRRKKI